MKKFFILKKTKSKVIYHLKLVKIYIIIELILNILTLNKLNYQLSM